MTEREQDASELEPGERKGAGRRGATNCVYCGVPCAGRACHVHRELLAVDPHYQTPRQMFA